MENKGFSGLNRKGRPKGAKNRRDADVFQHFALEAREKRFRDLRCVAYKRTREVLTAAGIEHSETPNEALLLLPMPEDVSFRCRTILLTMEETEKNMRKRPVQARLRKVKAPERP